MKRQSFANRLRDLRLVRLGEAEEAGLWITSLPWPRTSSKNLALESQPTFVAPMGQWPGEPEGTPRRLLMIADAADRAPKQIALSDANLKPASARRLPTAEMELFKRSPHPEYVWERHLLRIRYGDCSIGVAMGLRTAGQIHWWEACRLVVLQQTEQCLIVEMGGAIPHRHMTIEELKKYASHSNPYLHKHNWLNGHLYARIHANGVGEIYAHHINSKFVDDGLPLEDAVPVIGFRIKASPDDVTKLCGAWDGTKDRINLGGVRFDVSEAARLATPNQPGRIDEEGGFVVWQPYLGVEVFGGAYPQEMYGDPFLYRAEKRVFPRGMARTIRFSLSLSDRSPRVVRYLAPAWWYGVCEELLPEPLLPVTNEYDDSLKVARKWIQDNIVCGGFEDGAVPRVPSFKEEVKGRMFYGPGWEGEMPYAQFLTAWRFGDAADYVAAIRSAYYFTDVAVDHAAKLVRLLSYPFGAFALPMGRLQGTIAAYLETGDPYLLRTAEAVITNSHWMNLNSWPRFAVGRDACYVRSAVLLYRYFAEEFYRKIAFDGAMTVVRSQQPSGGFGDQGGGTGIHGFGGYVTKPWMGLLALNGVLDYLELFPDVEPFQVAVKKFGDWLMAERWEHDGMLTWSYQHEYDGTRRYYCVYSAKYLDLPSPGRWHHETLARLLGYCAVKFCAPKYLDAWAASYRVLEENMGDHEVAAALQFIPWVQAKLWRATLCDRGIEIRPVHIGRNTPAEAGILTPEGEVRIRWDKNANIDAPQSVKVITNNVQRMNCRS